MYGDGSKLGLDNVICLYKFPRKIKLSEGKEIALCYGKNGFYIKCQDTGKSASVDGDFSNGELPEANILSQALERISDDVASSDQTNDKPKSTIIKKLDNTTTIWNGPYGPFVSQGRKIASIPKDIKPEDVTLDQIKTIIQDYYQKKQAKWKRKGKSKQ
jgi:DNA topoisomerase-1